MTPHFTDSIPSPDFRPGAHSPEFERALRLYAEAVATQRLALEVHARCHRRRATDRVSTAAPVRMEATSQAHVERSPVMLRSIAPADVTVDQLTPRQREVVRLISRGCTNAEIADALVVTRGTAANHVAAILMRLGFSNRTQVATWAVAVGLSGPASVHP